LGRLQAGKLTGRSLVKRSPPRTLGVEEVRGGWRGRSCIALTTNPAKEEAIMASKKTSQAKPKSRPARKPCKNLRHKKEGTPPTAPPPPAVDCFPGFSVTQQRFLTAYTQLGNITAASEAAGISRQNHYDWMAEVPGYPAAFRQAGEAAVDRLVEEARRRAMLGSDVLLIFLLKGLRPEVFRDNHHLTVRSKVDHGGTIVHQVEEAMSDEQRIQRITELLARAQSRRLEIPDASGAGGAGCLAGATVAAGPDTERPGGDPAGSDDGAGPLAAGAAPAPLFPRVAPGITPVREVPDCRSSGPADGPA
jgi:hypothetical protein